MGGVKLTNEEALHLMHHLKHLLNKGLPVRADILLTLAEYPHINLSMVTLSQLDWHCPEDNAKQRIEETFDVELVIEEGDGFGLVSMTGEKENVLKALRSDWSMSDDDIRCQFPVLIPAMNPLA